MPRNPTNFDPERVRANIEKASDRDLLDRITAYRDGMEPEAILIIEQELKRRGVTPEQIEAHTDAFQGKTFLYPDGTARRCNLCRRPAVERGWTWHRLFGKIPVFPRVFYWCEEHRPEM